MCVCVYNFSFREATLAIVYMRNMIWNDLEIKFQ